MSLSQRLAISDRHAFDPRRSSPAEFQAAVIEHVSTHQGSRTVTSSGTMSFTSMLVIAGGVAVAHALGWAAAAALFRLVLRITNIDQPQPMPAAASSVTTSPTTAGKRTIVIVPPGDVESGGGAHHGSAPKGDPLTPGTPAYRRGGLQVLRRFPYTVKEVGRGASATIYRALHRDTNAVCALKALHVGGSKIGMLREFESMSHIRHENVVRVYGVLSLGTDPTVARQAEGTFSSSGGAAAHVTQLYLVEEYCGGGALSDWVSLRASEFKRMQRAAEERAAADVDLSQLARQPTAAPAPEGSPVLPPPPPLIVSERLLQRVAVALLRGLSAVHEAGIVHRDLKPSNVFVSETGILKIGDFDTSRSTTTQSDGHSIIGSVPYLAPEVVVGGHHSFASDLWALGATLSEVATGELPWIDLCSAPNRDPGCGANGSAKRRPSESPSAGVTSVAVLRAIGQVAKRSAAASPAAAPTPQDGAPTTGPSPSPAPATTVAVALSPSSLPNHPSLPSELSSLGLAFFRKLFHLDPAERSSSEALLKHPWIARDAAAAARRDAARRRSHDDDEAEDVEWITDADVMPVPRDGSSRYTSTSFGGEDDDTFATRREDTSNDSTDEEGGHDRVDAARGGAAQVSRRLTATTARFPPPHEGAYTTPLASTVTL